MRGSRAKRERKDKRKPGRKHGGAAAARPVDRLKFWGREDHKVAISEAQRAARGY